VLLRIRADFDNDGITDLALSESSTWGNAGTLFFSPGAATLRPLTLGISELASYVRMSASRGTLQLYRVTSTEISRTSELSLDLERPSDRERYEGLLPIEGKLPVEYCKLLEYRRDPANCWRPGLGLR